MQAQIPLKLFLRTVPDGIHSLIISRACIHLMRGQTFVEKLTRLEGKVICLTVTDTDNCFCFKFTSQGLNTIVNNNAINHADVHVKGSLKTFILLATHNEDPDTLFFNQELSLEGNTEDGLYLRNIMDSLEFNTLTHLQSVFGSKATTIIEPIIDCFNLQTRLQAIIRSLV